MELSVIAIGSEGPRGSSLRSDSGGSLLEERISLVLEEQTGKFWFR